MRFSLQRQPIPFFSFSARWEPSAEGWNAFTRLGGRLFAHVSGSFIHVLGGKSRGDFRAWFEDGQLSLSIGAPFLKFNELVSLRVAKKHTVSGLLPKEEGVLYKETIRICVDSSKRVFRKLWKSAPEEARRILAKWFGRLDRLRQSVPEKVTPKYDGVELSGMHLKRSLAKSDFGLIAPLPDYM